MDNSKYVDYIIGELNSDIVGDQAFKITGSKRILMLASIEKRLKEDDKWIIVKIRPDSDITNELVKNLYEDVPFIAGFIDENLNLSAFGIGSNTSKSPAASLDAVLGRLLKEIKQRKKKVLVLIDNVRKTSSLIDFIQTFQILIRRDYPIYLIIAGLNEDIDKLQNSDGCNFLYRAPDSQPPRPSANALEVGAYKSSN